MIREFLSTTVLPCVIATLSLAGPASAQTTTLVSTFAGAQSVDVSKLPAISGDGRYVAFLNVGPDPLDGCPDIWLRDTLTGITTAITTCAPGCTVSPCPLPAVDPAISADGTYLGYGRGVWAPGSMPGTWVSAGIMQILVRPTAGGTPEAVSLNAFGAYGNAASGSPTFSEHGTHVAFDSIATNLAAVDNNAASDVLVRNRATGQTVLVSAAYSGGGTGSNPNNNANSLHPRISPNGRHVAFDSAADDLLAPGLDTNLMVDIFVRDRDPDGNGILDDSPGTTVRVSVSSAGAEANGHCVFPAISADGRFVTWEGWASNLAPDLYANSDIFLHDRDPDGNGTFDEGNGLTTIVSRGSLGQQSNGDSSHVSISGDGRFVAFESTANNLDANSSVWQDVYVHDRLTGQTQRVSVASDGTPGNSNSSALSGPHDVAISSDGTRVAFVSRASNLVPFDANGNIADVFVHDVCPSAAADLGFAKAGTGGLFPDFSLCGSLAGGSFATARLLDAAPAASAYLVASVAPSPIAVAGGTFVPFPPLVIIPFLTDAAGRITFTVGGGGGPLDLWAQWAIADTGATFGVSFSNALLVTFLP